MKQYGALEKMLPVTPLKVNNLLQQYQKYMWYQDEISLEEHRLVPPLDFGVTGRNKLKYPDIIKEIQWK